jgi:hypothetical protein
MKAFLTKVAAGTVSQAASEAAGHGDKEAEAESPGANLYFLRSGTVLQTGSAGLGSNLYPEGTAPAGRGSERQDADSAMHGPKARYKVGVGTLRFIHFLLRRLLESSHCIAIFAVSYVVCCSECLPAGFIPDI